MGQQVTMTSKSQPHYTNNIHSHDPKPAATDGGDRCDDSGSRVPLRYIYPELTMSKEEMNLHRDDNLRCSLASKKLQLILDLDHTLIHTKKTNNLTADDKERIKSVPDVHEVFVAGTAYAVKLRPVKSMFDVSIYTMGTRAYAQEVYKLLEAQVRFPKGSWVIAREDCTKEKQKRLDVVLSHPSIVVIVDDTKAVWGDSCAQNLVQIGRYDYFPVKKSGCGVKVDNELGRVLRILKGLHHSFYDNSSGSENENSKDVRELIKLAAAAAGVSNQDIGKSEEEQQSVSTSSTSKGMKRSRSESDERECIKRLMMIDKLNEQSSLVLEAPRLSLVH